MLKIIEKTRLWFTIAIIIIGIGLGFMATKGLNFGIDFKGGTLVVLDMGNAEFQKSDVEDIFKKQAQDVATNIVNNTSIEIRSNDLDHIKVDAAFKEIKDKYKLDDKALVSQEEIGAAVGKELTNKAIIAIIVANALILVYIAFRFELKFGIAAVAALIHDVLITLSVYAIFNIPINAPFISAILTVVGYSMNDTIVIFDRIRENIKLMRRNSVEEIANTSINQSMKRSLFTVTTVLITIISVYCFVPSVRDFAFPLIVGIASGAFSSIFIASPIWVLLKNRSKRLKSLA